MPDDIQLFDEQPVGRFPTRPLSDARIAAYRVMPWPDGTRVTVEMTMTPFREFPDFDVLIVSQTGDKTGELLRQSSMVASMERQPAPTLWLPKLDKGTPLLAVMQILGNGQVLQTVEVPFVVGGPIIKQEVGASE
jgi:hypothetical protein